MDSQFSKAGSELYHKLNKRLKDLRARVMNEESIAAQSPSFELKRAKSSVAYHSKLLEVHDTEVEERINKIRQEAAIKRLEKEQNLAAAKLKLEEEEKKVPRSVLKAKHELLQHIKHFQESLSMPKSFFPELADATPVVQSTPPAVPEFRVKPSFEIVEDELAQMRRLAQEDIRKRKQEEEEKRQRDIEEHRRRRELEEAAELKRQDEKRRKELESQALPSNTKVHFKKELSEEEEEDMIDPWDLDGMTEQAKESYVRCNARAGMKVPDQFKKYLAVLPASAPPALPKKPIKRTAGQISTINGLAAQKYGAPSDE